MEYVDVDGLRIAYERAGSGPPLVLLHGGVGDGPTTWRAQLDGLADSFSVIAWDAPGAGESDDPPAWFRLPDYSDCVAGFVAALGLDRPHVAGLSFGAGLALQLYDRHPSLPRSLILAGAYTGWAGSLPPDRVEHRLELALGLADRPPEELVDALLPSMFSGDAPRTVEDRFAASMAASHPAGVKAMARSFAEADLRGVLPRIDVPTLLVYGDEDVRSPLHVAREIHEAIPDSELVVLEGVGHVCCMEAPDRFNAAVRSFLERVAL